MSDFQKRLETSMSRSKRRTKPAKVKRQRVWWGKTHTTAALVLVALLVCGGVIGNQWLDGRSISQGLDDVLNKSEQAHGDNKESEYDLGPAPVFKDCAALRQVYPTGLAQAGNPKVYDANRALDVNKNKFVCEDNE